VLAVHDGKSKPLPDIPELLADHPIDEPTVNDLALIELRFDDVGVQNAAT
jgi:hypothetical protein